MIDDLVVYLSIILLQLLLKSVLCSLYWWAIIKILF